MANDLERWMLLLYVQLQLVEDPLMRPIADITARYLIAVRIVSLEYPTA